MFWNFGCVIYVLIVVKINRKHEMFWNQGANTKNKAEALLTVNMKCFEIRK